VCGERSRIDAPKDLQGRLYDEYRIEIPVVEHCDERFIPA